MAASKKMDPGKLTTIYSQLFDELNQLPLRIMHRTWFRNILYYLGEQWFEWVRGQNTFRKIMPNAYIPTPVSNIIRDYVRSMKSLILNKDYSTQIFPNSNDQEDRDAAEMGEAFLKWMESFNDEQALDEKEKIAIWMVLVGCGFDRTMAQTDEDSFMFDKSGNIIKTGNVISRCMNPFSLSFDRFGNVLKEKRYIGIKTLRPKEWVEDQFKVKLGTSDGDKMLIDYERKLATLVANVSPWKGDGLEMTQDLPDEDVVLLKEVECRPTKDFPKGHYSMKVGDQTVFEVDRLPIPTGKEGAWDYSITDFHYHFVPGRYFSDSGVNDLVSPQNTVNEIDQDLSVNRKGIGKPMVLVPGDVSMQRMTKYGQSVIVIKYDAMLSGGQKPEFGRGIPLPAQVLEERAIHMQAAQDAAGDPKNVMRGKAPTQQASGIMVDILKDAAEQGHLPDVDRFYRALKRVKRKQLILAQEVYTEARLIKIPDRADRPKVIKFKGSDLRNNTDVQIELASGAASTRAGKVALVLKLTEQGFWTGQYPMDPEDKQEVLRLLGLGGFRSRDNQDLKRAMGENDMLAGITDPEQMAVASYLEPGPPVMDPQTGQPVMDEMGMPLLSEQQVQIPIVPGLFAGMWMGNIETDPIVLSDDPVFEFDKHDIHYECHRRFIVSREFPTLIPEVRDAMIVHCNSHKAAMEQVVAKQQMDQINAQVTAEAGMAQAQAAGEQPQGPPPNGGDGGGEAIPGGMSGLDMGIPPMPQDAGMGTPQ